MLVVIMIFYGLVLLLNHVTPGTARCCLLELRGTISVKLPLGISTVGYMRLIDVTSVRLSRHTTERLSFIVLGEFVCDS